jgi:hypothetical protein
LNLYAEWLVCQLYHDIKTRWPGRQAGLDATYRQLEFHADEWCDCPSGKRYGVCHFASDNAEVKRLKAFGQYQALPARTVPKSIIKFAKSRWSKLPDLAGLHLFPYAGQPPCDTSQPKPSDNDRSRA